MADDYVEKIAGELAELALADERRSEDDRIVDDISEIVGASSQTLQEAFLTAVRVRRAERRARQLLADRAAEQLNNATPLLTKDQAPADQEATPETPQTPDQPDTQTDDDPMIAEIDNLIKPSRPGRN